MATANLYKDPPFRLAQELANRRKPPPRLEAWPTGQGDYFLAGRDTFPIRHEIAAAAKKHGGNWDNDARKWFVSRAAADALNAVVLYRVLRAPVCCEKQIDPDMDCESLATIVEIRAQRIVVRTCPHCKSAIFQTAAIRDLCEDAQAAILGRPTVDPRKVPPWEG